MKSDYINAAIAIQLAKEIQAKLEPYVERIDIVGSVRRLCPVVRDIEFLFIPKREVIQRDLEGHPTEYRDLADNYLQDLLRDHYLEMRRGENGSTAWGPKNKLAVHLDSRIPVDFFSTTNAAWYNSLVIRTGGKTTNLRLTAAARAKGYSLEAYGEGFRPLGRGERFDTKSERDVFEFVGLPYLEPSQRP